MDNLYDPLKLFELHHRENILINASSQEIFAYVDDHHRFSSHMSKSSWMMGGSKMHIMVDADNGQKVGSHIRMNGKVFGLKLYLDEVVTQREPPSVKRWETVGDLQLFVIGHYRMSIEIKPHENQSLVSISIEYNLPTTHVLLGDLFGGMYAKWCVRQMIQGIKDNFRKT